MKDKGGGTKEHILEYRVQSLNNKAEGEKLLNEGKFTLLIICKCTKIY